MFFLYHEKKNKHSHTNTWVSVNFLELSYNSKEEMPVQWKWKEVFSDHGSKESYKCSLSLPLLFINAASAHTAPAPAESYKWPVCSGLYMKWQELHSLTPQTKLFTQLGWKWAPGDSGCCQCSLRLCDGKASYQLLIPTHHRRHFLSPPVMLMQLEFHKSNLSSKKVNKFTLYNWKPYWWLKGFYVSVFWVIN